MPKAFLGFDVGHKRIGIAHAQTVTCQTRPLITLERNGLFETELTKIITAHSPNAFVIGLPLDVNDKPLPSITHAKQFEALLLDQYELPVYWFNERYSTKLAKKYCFEHGIKRKNTQLDDIAAAIILQSWLSENSPQ